MTLFLASAHKKKVWERSESNVVTGMRRTDFCGVKFKLTELAVSLRPPPISIKEIFIRFDNPLIFSDLLLLYKGKVDAKGEERPLSLYLEQCLEQLCGGNRREFA